MRDDYTRIGKAQGIAQGIAEGMAKGMAKGKVEEKQATAIRLLKEGVSINLIQAATDLPIAAILDIAKSQKLRIASPTSD